MDELDRKILNKLQQDGRCTYANLGRLVGLSVTAIKERLDKLHKSGVLKKYTIDVDERKVGYSILAIVFIDIEKSENCSVFENAMQDLPQVQECHHVTGGFNYILKVVAADMAALESVLATRIKLSGIVSRSETTIVFSSPKKTAFLECMDIDA